MGGKITLVIPSLPAYMPGMDSLLDQEIASRRKKIAEWRRNIELAEAELRGFEQARKFIAPSSNGSNVSAERDRLSGTEDQAERRRSGRQPGAISSRWKTVLANLHGTTFSPDDVIDTVYRLEGRRMKPTEVRRMFEGYAEHGFVEILEGDQYLVTDHAFQKLALAQMKNPAEAGSLDDGSVAERSIAPDSKSGGAAPEKKAPVGSNPTTSAPNPLRTNDFLGSSSLATQTSNPTFDRR
jgi:hypothetical protein